MANFIDRVWMLMILGVEVGGCETGEGDILYPKKISLSLFFGCCGFFT